MRLPRARIVNGHLMSEPSLDPPEDPPEGRDPQYENDDYDDSNDSTPEYDRDCSYWDRC